MTSALEEFDAPGREEFVLMHGGQAYGARAVLSAAHQKATGTAVPEHDWSSKDQAARILRELGFRVLAGDDPEAVVPVTGTGARPARSASMRHARGVGRKRPERCCWRPRAATAPR